MGSRKPPCGNDLFTAFTVEEQNITAALASVLGHRDVQSFESNIIIAAQRSFESTADMYAVEKRI